MYFTGNDDYQNFLVLAPMLSALTVGDNKKVIKWISTGISFKKIKLFDTNLKPTTSNIANGRVILKFNNPVPMQKNFSSLYITSF